MASTPSISLDLPRELHGLGELRCGDRTMPGAFSVRGHPHRPAEDWHVELRASTDEWSAWDAVLHDRTDPLSLHGTLNGGQAIVVPRVQSWHHEGARFTGMAHHVVIDCEPLPDVPEHQRVTVYLTPSKLARRHRRPHAGTTAGDLAATAAELDGPDVTVPSDVGTLHFVLNHVAEKVTVDGVRATLEIPTPVLWVDVAPEARGGDPYAVMQAVDAALEDVLQVLTLLSRRYVRWTRMKAASTWVADGRPRHHRGSEWLRTIGAPPSTSARAALVNAWRMPPDALGQLITTYRADPRRATLRSASTYCVAAYEADVLETKYMAAFTAIEALLTANPAENASTSPAEARDATDAPVATIRHPELDCRLAQEVAAYAAEKALSTDMTDRLTGRLADLYAPVPRQGRSKGRRAAGMVTAAGVRWDDLWPAGTDLATAFRCAFNRRNEFFHEGRFPEASIGFTDAARLRILAERVLLARLGGTEEWQSHLERETPPEWLAKRAV